LTERREHGKALHRPKREEEGGEEDAISSGRPRKGEKKKGGGVTIPRPPGKSRKVKISHVPMAVGGDLSHPRERGKREKALSPRLIQPEGGQTRAPDAIDLEREKGKKSFVELYKGEGGKIKKEKELREEVTSLCHCSRELPPTREKTAKRKSR